MQTQKTLAKDSLCPKKSKIKDPKSALLHDNKAEPAKKKNKKKRLKYQWEHMRETEKTPAIGNIIVNATKEKKKRDTSEVTCYIYNKKEYYTSNCIKP